MRPGCRSIAVYAALLLALAGRVHAQAPSDAAAKLGEDIATANRILADQQVLDAYGHVSARHPSRPDHFLMGRNLAPALVTPADVVEYDLDGQAINPPAGATHFLERFIHAEVYRARPDVGSVVHTHSPAVIPFSVTRTPMRPLYHMSSFLAPGVPDFEIRDAAGPASNLLVSNGAIGKALAATLGDKNVVLMRGHGNVVVAATLPMAVFRAVYTETNARLQSQAMTIGGDITFLNAEEGTKAMSVLDQIHLRAWNLWKQRVNPQ
ncbi:MAG TPA: class II aldolase/adducin family protein [Hyphomicrobiaceae bacterium]|nr:class II aldolase/adducin family protein [Hyphomicrobiaceae bacterium]